MTISEQELDRASGDLFPERLRRALAARGLSLERLSARLAERGVECSASTLSLWRNGRVRPSRLESLRALHTIELILATPPGYLTEAPRPPAVGSSRWWAHAADPEAVLHAGDRFARAVESLGGAGADDLRRLAVVEIARIDERRRFCGSTCQVVVQAARADVERMVVATYTVGSLREAGGLRTVRPLEGARLGRRRLEAGTGQVLSELIFDAPLRRGERHVVNYQVVPSDGPEPPLTEWGRHELRSVRPIARLVLGVDFAPGAVPDRVEAVEDPCDISGGEEPRRDIVLQGNRALISRDTMSHGGARIEWSWEGSR